MIASTEEHYAAGYRNALLDVCAAYDTNGMEGIARLLAQHLEDGS